jgi:hypothetical protein
MFRNLKHGIPIHLHHNTSTEDLLIVPTTERTLPVRFLGLDRKTNDTIGVAFNASWIGGAILCGVGTADNIGAFEWAVDPDGDDDTTDDIPDVINNSWRTTRASMNWIVTVYMYLFCRRWKSSASQWFFLQAMKDRTLGTITQPHNININEVNTLLL